MDLKLCTGFYIFDLQRRGREERGREGVEIGEEGADKHTYNHSWC